MNYPIQKKELSEVSLPHYAVRVSKKAKRIILRILPHKGLEVVLPAHVGVSCVPNVLAQKREWIEKVLVSMGFTATGMPAESGAPDGKWAGRQLPPVPFTFATLGGAKLVTVVCEKKVHPMGAPASADGIAHVFSPKTLQTLNITEEMLKLGVVPSKVTPPVNYSLVLPLKTQKNEDRLTEPSRLWLKEWVRVTAKKVFLAELTTLCKKYDFSFTSLRVGFPATRWGSCSSKGALSLSAHLLFFPLSIVQYVMVHELCHTRHLNHSEQFWKAVFAIEPNALAIDKSLRYAKKYIPLWALD